MLTGRESRRPPLREPPASLSACRAACSPLHAAAPRPADGNGHHSHNQHNGHHSHNQQHNGGHHSHNQKHNGGHHSHNQHHGRSHGQRRSHERRAY
jgi:hypothetical protein